MALSRQQRILNISNTCGSVAAHKLSSQLLLTRCEELISLFPSNNNQSSLSSFSQLPLDDLLRDIDEFVKEFVKPIVTTSAPTSTSTNRAAGTNKVDDKIISWFESVLDDLDSDLKIFQDLNKRIQDLKLGDINLQNLSISPNNNSNNNNNRFEDCEAVQNDLKAFFDEIRKQQGTEPRFLQLRTRCVGLLTQLNVANSEILEFQNQIECFTLENVDHNNQNENQKKDNDNIRSQLTQIHHMIEDFITSSNLIPQQQQLINDLNDSLVASMSQFHQSLLTSLSAEMNKLRETTEKFHANLASANLETKQELRAIIQGLDRLEHTKKEEVIRQHTLSRLEKFQSDFTVDDSSFLGEGSFGVVKRGVYGNGEVAIKVIQVKGRGGPFNASMKKSIENEVLLMSMCHHPCILQIYGYCKIDPRTTCLILELGLHGSLWSILENKEDFPSIPLSLSIAWISDLVCALCYIHDEGILHRDVKAENIMLSEGLRCKLTDFGLSKQQMERSSGVSSSHHDLAGTLPFMAPEVRIEGKCNHRSDMFSCAVTCYQIILRSSPSRSTQVSEIIDLLLSFFLNVESWKKFVIGCLEADSKNRLSSFEAMKLITEVQNCELIGGDPRSSSLSHSATPTLTRNRNIQRHKDANEVEVLNRVLKSGHSGGNTSSLNPEVDDAKRLDLYYSLYAMSLCGNAAAFNQLQSISEAATSTNERERVICLGYLLMLLDDNPIPSVIPIDKEKAISISRDILPMLDQMIREDAKINHHVQFILSVVYGRGIGVEKNKTEAIRLLSLSSDQGFAPAQYALGGCYLKGDGVKKNETEGIRLLTLASNQGFAPAQGYLGDCYLEGNGVEKDETEAIQLLFRSSLEGFAPAQFTLSSCYLYGIGVEKNETEGIRLLSLSSNQGFALAANLLKFLCYIFGSGCSVM